MIDPELASWQREWHEQSEQLPDLKKKIKRQDRHGMLQAGLVCALLIVSLVAVWHFETSLSRGFATGVWFSCLIMGVYVWRARRGTWKPAAQSTAAYLGLLHKRAVAKHSIVQFAFRFLLATTVLYAGFMAWRWEHFSAIGAGVLAATIAELFYLHYLASKRRREVDATQQVLFSAENSKDLSGERQA
jgi:hypothetical protein